MEVLWNLLAIFSITFIVANISLSALFSLVSQQFLKIEVKSRKALLWLIAFSPWVISVALSVLIFLSYHAESDLNNFSFLHWHHMSDFEWHSWHGYVVGLSSLYIVYVFVTGTIKLWAHKREIDSLTQFATKMENGVYKVDSKKASAFSTGFIWKKCFVTTDLVDKVTSDEFDVVINHEMAHINSNDPLKKWAFALLCSFFLQPIALRLKLHMTLAMEQEADNTVINSGISKIFVASTLIKIAKFNAKSGLVNNNDLVANFGADVLEQRIYFLLDKLTLEPINKSITAILLLMLVVISTTSIDGIHHFMETLFSH